MTYEESIPIARELALRSLEKGFDVEAFLVLSNIDKIPSSSVDEITDQSIDLFARFINNRSIENLDAYLEKLYCMISEVYHTAETQEERNSVAKFIASLTNVLQ